LGVLEERHCCQSNGLRFLSFPIEDRSVRLSFHEIDGWLNSVTAYLRNGEAVGVHCRAGIGRSSMMVASTLIRNGLSVDSAFSAVQEARGCSVPVTPEKRKWVERYSSRLDHAEK
jgi:protein-tyrosine phosphatase